MAVQKLRNPLAQALGIVLQGMRDQMGGISSSQVASMLGLAASHYRMIEAGSAILQPSRAMRVAQSFDTIEFVPLCQILVSIQILDTARQSARDMATTAGLLTEADPGLARVIDKLNELWDVIEKGQPSDVAHAITAVGLKDELTDFLATKPVAFTADEIDNFMSPTYEHPLSGRLYSKIGNILQGIAPFYLDTVLQLIDNLRDVTPRVTAEELAKWEQLHKNRFSHIIGVVRRPEIILDVSTFDYGYLWDESFERIVIVYRDEPPDDAATIQERIAANLRKKFESKRLRYEHELDNFDTVVADKLQIISGSNRSDQIDQILQYRDLPMNNLWIYLMVNGYVVPFIDDSTVDSHGRNLYGTSLGYDETCEKLAKIRKLCSDVGFKL